LAKLYKELGKPTPLDARGLADLLRKSGTEKALAAIEKDRKNFPEWNLTTENNINLEGYHQLQAQDIATAIKVFELNTLLFPNSGNTFDSLGEAYLIAGNKKAAASNYKKSLELDPKNSNAKRVLEELGEKLSQE